MLSWCFVVWTELSNSVIITTDDTLLKGEEGNLNTRISDVIDASPRASNVTVPDVEMMGIPIR